MTICIVCCLKSEDTKCGPWWNEMKWNKTERRFIISFCVISHRIASHRIPSQSTCTCTSSWMLIVFQSRNQISILCAFAIGVANDARFEYNKMLNGELESVFLGILHLYGVQQADPSSDSIELIRSKSKSYHSILLICKQSRHYTTGHHTTPHHTSRSQYVRTRKRRQRFGKGRS